MMKWLGIGVCAVAFAAPVMGAAQPVKIPGGLFDTPVLLDSETPSIAVETFWLDATPVTNHQFLTFVQAQPDWQRSNIAALFHDGSYLSHWPADTAIAEQQRDAPVTYVSWFAARAYCEAQGGRLPTLNEWEYASVLYRQQQALTDEDYARQLFAWYSNPGASQQQPVAADAQQLAHMHGRINEWVEDFQLLIQSGDEVDVLSGSCGDSARFLAKFNQANYATFFRYQSRSDYAAQSTTSTLGFRCAYDQRNEP